MKLKYFSIHNKRKIAIGNLAACCCNASLPPNFPAHLAACIVAEHGCPLLAFLLGELHQETHPRDHQTDIKLPPEQAFAESAIDPSEAKESAGQDTSYLT